MPFSFRALFARHAASGSVDGPALASSGACDRMRIGVMFAMAFGVVQAASGQIEFIEDFRKVEASGSMTLAAAGGGSPQVFEEDLSDMPDPLFGAFDRSRLALLLGPGGNTTTALAVQSSEATENGLSASGLVETQVNLVDAAAGSSASASASSVYDIRFRIPEGEAYQIAINGSIRAESPDDGGRTNATVFVNVGIAEPTRVRGIFRRSVFGGNGEQPLLGLLNLDAGEWGVSVEIASDASAKDGNPGQSEVEFDIALEVVGEPCNRADLAEPFGVFDLQDVAVFANGYITQSGISDLREPFGLLCLEDIAGFVTAFQIGCP